MLRGVYGHHERLDGSGYPRGFSGWTIPWMARALAVAEVYDALTTTQPWRARMEPVAALQLMRDEMAEGLDMGLLRALILEL